ncbi:general negative regulator of transcription subunit 5 [Physocladia obscura]|uniref:General negative regulator of transcription subunit 5 n=1 Tax=Physocladia obscura TaxID=109957 RepID=A0AAD5T165_9FUNG|nr:general negative regulator of transcription subunit 5 [Physocladia obscura]
MRLTKIPTIRPKRSELAKSANMRFCKTPPDKEPHSRMNTIGILYEFNTGRKLQTEIDKVLKLVTLGVEAFEEVFDKLQVAVNTGNSTQKDKLEADLKKEIKKLQRFRDQIKTWISSPEVKDKKPLTDNRRLIETQMEKFKACEKELKTKAFSKEGLSAAQKLDPLERERIELADTLRTHIESLETQIDAFEFEVEKIKSTMGKKKDKSSLEKVTKLEHGRERHKHHIKMLEIVLRMFENNDIEMDPVKGLLEDVAYYVESNRDPDFDEDEGIYDDLNLNDAEAYGINADEGQSEDSEDGILFLLLKNTEKKQLWKETDQSKLKAEVKATEEATKKTTGSETPSPVKPTSIKVVPAKASLKEEVKLVVKGPLPKPTAPNRTGSTASTDVPTVATPIIPQSTIRYAVAAAQSPAPTAPINTQQIPPIQETGIEKKPDNYVPVAVVIAAAAQQSAAQQAAFQSPSRTNWNGEVATQISGASISTALSIAQKTPVTHIKKEAAKDESATPQEPLSSGLPPALKDMVTSFVATKERCMHYLVTYLEISSGIKNARGIGKGITCHKILIQYLHIIPKIRYRSSKTQLYLAARELKKQSWRFHKKYSTWFQRFEEPKAITDEYEQGTYVYFDFEGSWSQCKKLDFRALPLRCFSATIISKNATAAPKIIEIVDKIQTLTLIETAALVQELKTRLNIQDIAMPAAVAASAAAVAPPVTAAVAPVAEEKAPEQTEFKVRLEKFDAAAKAKIIREVKNIIPGANLVEAKKFVESVPKVLKENVPKEEAEKLKKLLEDLGATVVLE